ncbi:MAG: four helix bundle protein [Anaerolineales bacterium]|nr:four helix bundle protein [Anaerolineales bacterium]
MQLLKASYKSPEVAGKRGFEDLECFKLALDVVVNAHAFARTLPPEEKYDLAMQIRRAAKSVTANIAEGYGRYHYLDGLKFYSNARGSLNEVLGHLVNAKVLNYCEQEYFDTFYMLIRRTEKALNGFMNYVRQQKAGEDASGSRTLREESAEYEITNETEIP